MIAVHSVHGAKISDRTVWQPPSLFLLCLLDTTLAPNALTGEAGVLERWLPYPVTTMDSFTVNRVEYYSNSTYLVYLRDFTAGKKRTDSQDRVENFMPSHTAVAWFFPRGRSLGVPGQVLGRAWAGPGTSRDKHTHQQ